MKTLLEQIKIRTKFGENHLVKIRFCGEELSKKLYITCQLEMLKYMYLYYSVVSFPHKPQKLRNEKFL